MAHRTARPPRGRLERSAIIEASIAVLDAGELDTLSMRSLADRLGVTPMALYVHVEDKDDILDEVLDVALRRDASAAPAPADPASWGQWLAEFASQLRELLLRHPTLLDRYLRAPVAVPAALDRMEAAIAVLLAAGFSDAQAVDVYAAVHTFTIGFAALESARTRPRPSSYRGVGVTFDARSPGYWPAFFGALPVDRYPNLSRVQPDLSDFTAQPRFRRAIDDLLGGYRPGDTGPAHRSSDGRDGSSPAAVARSATTRTTTTRSRRQPRGG